MNVKEELERHRLPCGPVTVSVRGVCRRRLQDRFDTILGKLSELTDQEYKAPKAPKGHELVDGKVVAKGADQTPEEKGQKMFEEGVTKNKVKSKLKEHAASLEPEEEPEPTLEDRRKEMLKEAKMKAEVKVKAKEHETKLMGNSRLLQDTTGKINKR